MKKKSFTICYSFDGQGSVRIEATSQKEAEELFKEGYWDAGDNEWGDNYEIIEITEEG